MFKKGSGDWKEYRKLGSFVEVDFHYSERGRRWVSYDEAMGEVYETALAALKQASEEGISYVIFTHGWSTSRPGKTTARSTVRGLMRSQEATPFICRRECIQHDSVFVAAIRPAKLT